MFTVYLSSISTSLELWLVKHISMYENSELIVFKNVEFLGEISSNRASDFIKNQCTKDY